MLETLISITSQDSLMPLSLIAAGILCICLRLFVTIYTNRKRKIRTKRVYGKIVSYKKRINTDSADDYLPVLEFSISDKSYTVTSLYAQSKPAPPEFAKSGKIPIAFDPKDPQDADMDAPELRKMTALALSIFLYAGLTLIVVGSLGLYF